MWKRELIRNKIYAVLMVLASLPVVILERDGTVLLLSLLFGVPMFFAKENWIMGGPVHESIVATFILKNGLLPTFFQKLDIFGRVERLVETVLAKKSGFLAGFI